MQSALTRGNKWANHSSLFIAVFSEKDLDCIIKERLYYLFDTGMATACLILRAAELGLVAHPIAGFREKEVKNILNIPDEMTVITLLCVGKKKDSINPELSEDHKKKEEKRPERKPLDEIAFMNEYK